MKISMKKLFLIPLMLFVALCLTPACSDDNPVTDEALLTKFISVSTLALGESTVKALADNLLKLDDLDDAYEAIVPYLSVKPATIRLFNV